MLKRRKNYLPTLLLMLSLWSILGLMVFGVDPELVKDILVPGLYLPFWLVFFPTSLITLALIFSNTKRGLITALGLTIILILRIYGLGNFLNIILVTGIVLAIDRL